MTSSKPGGLDSRLAAVPRFKARPLPARYGAAWSLILLLGDLLFFGLAALGAQAVTHQAFGDMLAAPGTVQTVLFGVAMWVVLFERVGMYKRTFSVNARDEVYACVAASALALLPALAVVFLVPALGGFRHLLLTTLLLATVGVSLLRFGSHAVRARVLPRAPRRIAVVGAAERVATVSADLSLAPSDAVMRIAVEDFDEELAEVVQRGDVSRLKWLRTALEHGCDELIVTEALPPQIVPALLRLTEPKGIALAFAPMRLRPHACDFQVRRDGGLALLYTRSLAICTPGAEFLRRVLDMALVVPAIVVLAPVMAAIALAVFLDSGAPIFYRQARVGKLGKEFSILKFRTMRHDAEAGTGPVWARVGESRTTRIGKFLRRTSLDELPQLFNVLSGEMSVVGPRPERPFYVEQFRKILPRYDERHLVRPGITGWAQVSMRRALDPSEIGEKLSFDLFYLEHWSIFMDALIVCKTAAEFLFQRGAA
jgi:exopolysaccharide biosynthesis polyprenyl glycosylphosphotransferase